MGSAMGYYPRDFMMEYKEGDFSGLYEHLKAGNLADIEVNGSSYVARFADAHYDGKTYKIKLEPVED